MGSEAPRWETHTITETTAKRYCYTEGLAQLVVQQLIGASCWFEVTPYPEDLWVFTFKNEWGTLREVDEIAEASIFELSQ